jgi:phage terminase large subunit
MSKQKVNQIQILTPRVFVPFLEPSRYKVAHGGRGSGKSHFFAELLVETAILKPGLRAVCIREVQKSLSQSVKRLIEDKIEKLGVGHMFEVLQSEIKTPGGGTILFQGMSTQTQDSIKSLEGIDVAWVEEAQSLSQRSLDMLRPTIRKPGSEIWFSFNPDQPTDPVDSFFRPTDGSKPPENAVVVEVNFFDNPFFPDVLKDEMEYDKRRDPDKYKHVWLGQWAARTETRVFTNWKEEEFETPGNARFYFGGDFGFSKDPTTLVRAFIGRWEDGQAIADEKGKCLFIDYEAYKVGCTIEDTPRLFNTIPEAPRWPIRADSARPETIDHLRRHGFPKITSSSKGKNSIIEGVEFIKSFDVIIHPRCKHVVDEFALYSYKVDAKTDEILPEIADGSDHCIDALRYGLELLRKAEKGAGSVSFAAPMILN